MHKKYTSTSENPATELHRKLSKPSSPITRVTATVRAVAKSLVFFLKVFPMIPSQPVNWVTKTPVVEKVTYPTRDGLAQGDLYRPPGAGPYPGILVCLGVVPFGVDHPQVSVLGNALARAGYAALLYWSPAMRDFRINTEDIENIPLAYHWLIQQPYIDPTRSGMIGTCVGASFALMSAASPLICDQIAFASGYAPFSSMWTFACDIASETRLDGSSREPWKVDQLTRRVFVHSITAWLEPEEAARLREAFADAQSEGYGAVDPHSLSAQGRSVYALLAARDAGEAEAALQALPGDMRDRFDALSPLNYLNQIHAPLIVLLHDEGDQLIPVGESRRLLAALAGRTGVHYTEMRFSHLDPVKGKLPFFRLLSELTKFYLTMYPIFRQSVGR